MKPITSFFKMGTTAKKPKSADKEENNANSPAAKHTDCEKEKGISKANSIDNEVEPSNYEKSAEIENDEEKRKSSDVSSTEGTSESVNNSEEISYEDFIKSASTDEQTNEKLIENESSSVLSSDQPIVETVNSTAENETVNSSVKKEENDPHPPKKATAEQTVDTHDKETSSPKSEGKWGTNKGSENEDTKNDSVNGDETPIVDKSTRSITSFFSKQDKKTIAPCKKEVEIKTITINVDVHPEPVIDIDHVSPKKKFSIFDKSSRKSGLKPPKNDSSKKPPKMISPKSNVSVLNSDFDDSICVIEEDKSVVNKKGKKRQSKASAASQNKETEKSEAKPNETKQEEDKEKDREKDAEKRQVLAAKLSTLDNVKVPVCKKNVQATIQFGSSSFKLTKAAVKEEPVKPVKNAKGK